MYEDDGWLEMAYEDRTYLPDDEYDDQLLNPWWENEEEDEDDD